MRMVTMAICQTPGVDDNHGNRSGQSDSGKDSNHGNGSDSR